MRAKLNSSWGWSFGDGEISTAALIVGLTRVIGEKHVPISQLSPMTQLLQ